MVALATVRAPVAAKPCRWPILAMAIALLGGCGVHLHDDRLATRAAAADEKLTAAQTLQPFDDQLGILNAFSAKEDLAVARYWTGRRDVALARVLASENPARTLRALIVDRLRSIAPAALANPALLRDLSGLPDKIAEETDHEETALALAAVNLGFFARLKQADDPRDPTCSDLETMTPAAIAALRRSAGPGDPSLAVAAGNCVRASADRRAIASDHATIASAGGLLRAVSQEAEAAGTATKEQLSPEAAKLDATIKQAEAWAEAGDSSKLEQFRSDVARILDRVGEATAAAGWEKLDKHVDALLRAAVCVAPEGGATDEEVADAECGKIGDDATAARGAAAFKLLQALAALSDANSPRTRQAQWLIAAKAIVAAERANAALRLELAKARADVAAQRLKRLVAEAAALSYGKLRLDGRRDLMCRGSAFECGFASYSGAWTEARIPGEVIDYHTLQAERIFAVRRARAVAAKQRALALAGTSSLNAYGEGGIRPSLVAQILFDLGIFGAQVGE